MKNKKGFTIIELIICIGLIILIGTSTTIAVVSRKNNKEDLSVITKRILEAANVYVESEKDENGNNYLNEIVSGAKGIKIPLTTLVSEGYIEESDMISVYSLAEDGSPSEGQDYYVMFVNTEENNYCGASEIESLSSWMNKGKTVYLCSEYKNKETKNIMDFLNLSKVKVNLDKYAVSEEYYDSHPELQQYLTKSENGIFSYYHEETDMLFSYYRGAVNNNYIEYGKDSAGSPLLWRIVWFREDNKIKLVLADEIQMYLQAGNKNLEVIDELKIYNVSYRHWKGYDRYSFTEPKIYDSTYKDRSLRKYYFKEENSYESFEYSEGHLLIDNYFRTDSDYENYLLRKTIDEWFDSTNLSTMTNLTTNQFCFNEYEGDNSGVINNNHPSTNFTCLTGVRDSDSANDGKEWVNDLSYGSFRNAQVTLLNYGDIVRMGVAMCETFSISSYPSVKCSKINNLNLKESGNYLFADNKKSKNILTSDYYTYYVGTNKDSKLYVASTQGFYTPLLEKDEDHLDVEYIGFYKMDSSDKIISSIENKSTSSDNTHYYEYTIPSGTLRPAIIVDISDYTFSNSEGTKQNPFKLILK